MKKLLTTFTLALSLAMTVPVILPQTSVITEAATKTSAYCYDTTIGINSTTNIWLSNQKANATYSYSSNKKSVATVSKKGVITGKAAGKAKITVKQTYKKKTTTVKTFTITVKKTAIIEDLQERGTSVLAQPGFVSESDSLYFGSWFCLNYTNPKAKYTFYSDNADLVMSKDGTVTAVKAAGTAKITVKETYKKKTRTVGSFNINMFMPEYTGEASMTQEIGTTFNIGNYVNNVVMYYFFWSTEELTDEELIQKANGETTSDSENTSELLELVKYDGYWYGDVKVNEAGTYHCYFLQYNYSTSKYDKVFGHFQLIAPDTATADDTISS